MAGTDSLGVKESQQQISAAASAAATSQVAQWSIWNIQDDMSGFLSVVVVSVIINIMDGLFVSMSSDLVL